LNKVREFIKAYPKLTVVMGVNTYHDFEPGEPLSPNARKIGQGDRERYIEVYNGAIELNQQNRVVPLHKKSKLVPGPEIFPFKKNIVFPGTSGRSTGRYDGRISNSKRIRDL
jgi:apolipoprotein N-acyltransferase